MKGNIRAIGLGWMAYALGSISYLVVDSSFESLPGYFGYLLYLMAFIGGIITGRLVKNRPIMNLILVGTLMGLTAGAINYLSWRLGFPADFGGFKGFQIVIAFAIPVFVVLSLFGGAVGFRDED